MKTINISQSLIVVIIFSFALAILSCDRSSSPEGRMSIRIEDLQKEMIDSLKQQNQAIRDSLGNIRKELDEIKQVVGKH